MALSTPRSTCIIGEGEAMEKKHNYINEPNSVTRLFVIVINREGKR